MTRPAGFIPPRTAHTRYGDFHEGLAKYFDGRWGFINPAGEVVIEPRFNDAEDFSEEFAVVRGSANGLFGYITRRGEMALPYKFYWASSFHEGLAAVQITKGYFGFIDNTGRVICAKKAWIEVNDFSQGRAAVQVEVVNDKVYRGYKERQYGFIDMTGKFVIPPQFDRVGKFMQGRALFGSARGYGFINSEGQVLIEPQFADAKGFTEGLAAVAVTVADEKKLWGFIDLQGQWAIGPQFKNAQSFSGGLAAVNCDEYSRRCQAYIDRQGNVRWQK